MSELVRAGFLETDASGQRLFRVDGAHCGGCRGCNAHRTQVLKLPASTTTSKVLAEDGPAMMAVRSADLAAATMLVLGLPIALALLVTWFVTAQEVAEWIVAATFASSMLVVALLLRQALQNYLRPLRLLAHLKAKPAEGS